MKVHNFDAVALSFARRSTCCPVCHVRLATSVEEPVAADCLASPSSTWQAPPPTTHHPPFWNPSTAATGGKWQVRQENLLSAWSLHSIHSMPCLLSFDFDSGTGQQPTSPLSIPQSPMPSRYHDCETRRDRSVPGPHSILTETPCRCSSRDTPPQAPQAPAPAPIRSLSISHVASRPVARQERTLLFPRRPDCQTTTHWPAAAGRRTLAPCLHGGAPAPAWPDLTTPGSMVRDSLTPTHQVLERAGLRGTRR